MRKNLTRVLFIIPLILSFVVYSFYTDYSENQRIAELLAAKKERKEFKKRTAVQRSEWEFIRLRNPKTDKIPRGIFTKEQEFSKQLPKRSERVLFKNGSAQNAEAITWQERGPNNLGGRTRAFAADSRNKNIMIAGGVSGGIWRSINNGSSWIRVTTTAQLPSISCIVQDPTDPDTWYAGTGEGKGNSASGSSSYYGNGIYKSTNNGVNWSLLSSTTDNVYVWDNDFEYVNSIAISPTTGTIFAAVNSSILRSSDDGTTWTRVLGTFNYLERSEVIVNTAGDIYATISSNADNPGIYKSTVANDGASATWTNIIPVSGVNSPANFPTNYPRIVLAHAPSNNNIVYFFAYTPNAGKFGSDAEKGMSFWKYDASKSGTAQWVDRSANLPTVSTNVAGNDSQDGYNQFVIVHPTNENFVITGTTNLYRSDDAFATPCTNTSANWIGGYAVADDISEYANHFPDQHSGYFEPGNFDIFYSGHDTGLSKTDDIFADPIVWSNIDDGYNVSQFYTVSLAPEMLSTFISGGLQDAGALFTPSGGLANWTAWQGGGDGAFTDVAPIGNDIVYAGVQNGSVSRFTRNNSWLAEITPDGAKNMLFVNPFILDPNDSQYLYYGGGNSETTSGIWRNSNATTSTKSSGWTHISSITSETDGNTSAIDVSYTFDADVVYYGTSEGKVYRITDAAGTPVTTNISAGLPGSGYVSGISIDPTNSDNVMIVLSNYGIASIFYTADGGGNWTDVEGNLASVDGPSVRSCEIFQVDGQTHYFVGTSIGLYYTLSLNGGSTNWTQEASSSIGNIVCDYIDWRSDAGTIAKTTSSNGTSAVNAVSLAIATHGRGVFQGTLVNPLPVELVTFAGIYNGSVVELQWQTATEVNNYGFEIQRKSSSKNEWEMIEFISGAGNSNSPKDYSYVDNSLFGGEKFYYRLKQVDIDGKFEFSSTVEISVVIDGYELSQNYPNPFNPSTKINYTIPETANVKVEVYSITGELVTKLVDLQQNAGRHSAEFNTSDYSNLSSGMYIYRISAQGISGKNFVQTRKMLLLK